ncbi:MAG: ABC transporter permease, partial [Planctomycetota bacterium]
MRDRRALFVGVVLPILLYPVLTLFITVMIGTQINNLTEEHYTIGVSPPAKFAEVKTWYQEQCAAEAAAIQPPAKPPGAAGIRPTNPTTAAGRSGAAATPSDDGSGLGGEAGGLRPMVPTTRTFNLDFVPVPSAKARQMLQEKSVKAVIEFEPTAPGDAIEPEAIPPPAGATEAPEPVIMVLKESADIRSRTAATYATGLLEFHRDQVTRERLRALGADPDRVLEPFRIDTSADISSKAEKGGALFGGMVPFILVIMLIGAASYPAMDVTTGERERGTMETLLIAPVRARDLVTGKFLAVFTMAVVACLFNVVSLGVSMYFAGAGIAQHLDLAIPWMSLPWVLLLLLPLAILFSALLMLAGSFAQSTKEAQTYLSPVLMAAMFPAMLAIVPGIELKGGWLFLPIGNVT